MALNAANIHVGAGRIWLNVTPPATGTPPTLLPHLAGVPTAGSPIEAGYTNGAATFTYKATKQEIEAEQSLNPVDIFTTTEMCQITFTAMEHTYNTLKTAFDNVGTVQDSNKILFYGGDGSSITNVITQCVALTSQRRDSQTKYEVITLYRVYNVEGIEMPYQRTTPAMYKVTLKGLVDGTRVAGDRLFQFYKELG